MRKVAWPLETTVRGDLWRVTSGLGQVASSGGWPTRLWANDLTGRKPAPSATSPKLRGS